MKISWITILSEMFELSEKIVANGFEIYIYSFRFYSYILFRYTRAEITRTWTDLVQTWSLSKLDHLENVSKDLAKLATFRRVRWENGA